MEPLIDDFLQSIKRSRSYKKQIVHVEDIPSQEASFGELEKPLPKNIESYLLNRKIKLYSHQAEAINKARAGKNVIIVTPTLQEKP
jgi:DEAD/DEAH box helicase domain-containing protein